MIYLKKLAFAPVFLFLLTTLFYLASPLLQSTELIFSPNLQTFYQLLALGALVLTSALFFTIFASLALNWKLVLPLILVSAPAPMLFIPTPLNLIAAVLVAASLLLNYLGLEGKMRSYLTFQASSLFVPSVKQLAGLLIVALSITYYLSMTKQVAEKGFEIPDSLIDSALRFIPQANLPVQELPQITPEQTELLKENPQLLEQYGIDPKMLEGLSVAKPNQELGSILNPTAELVKPMVKEQLQNMVNPYQKIIPAILALLFFLSLQSLTAFLGILLSLLIRLIFYILEKTNFIHFETEMREVKKMVL